MATAERDYYELLGVPRDADEAAIKRAFRARARELHPDVSDDPDAEARFKEVVEAYEVLSDPERRSTYDRYGHAGLRRGGFQPTYGDFGTLADLFAAFLGDDLFAGVTPRRRRSTRGGDVQAVVEISLEDAYAGTTVAVPVEVAAPCERCGATGAEPGTGMRTCATCGGVGAVRRVSRNVFGSFVHERTCTDCGGAGRVLESPCTACRGEGRVVVQRTLEVDVPPGIHDGQRIRIRGEGHSGRRGGDSGHAFVLVRVRPDPRFVRDGDDLHTALQLSMTDAALGAKVPVPSPAGELEVEVPPGTQPGEVLVLEGHGMPSLNGSRRGDLYVRLDVAIPTGLDEEQRRLLQAFAQTVEPQQYRRSGDGQPEDGFFRRLRSALR
jgi:molecular chaperone DnaJ